MSPPQGSARPAMCVCWSLVWGLCLGCPAVSARQSGRFLHKGVKKKYQFAHSRHRDVRCAKTHSIRGALHSLTTCNFSGDRLYLTCSFATHSCRKFFKKSRKRDSKHIYDRRETIIETAQSIQSPTESQISMNLLTWHGSQFSRATGKQHPLWNPKPSNVVLYTYT